MWKEDGGSYGLEAVEMSQRIVPKENGSGNCLRRRLDVLLKMITLDLLAGPWQ